MGDLDISASDLADFTGKVVLITGGSAGIGEAVVSLFLERGASVVNGDLQLPPSAHRSNARYKYLKTDVSSWNSQLELFQQTIQEHGCLDIVIANAGVDETEHAFEQKGIEKDGDPVEPKWTTIKVNLVGSSITFKLALFFLRKQSNGGRFIFTGSRASYDNFAMPVYTASKHAILGLVRCFKHHTSQWNIQVNMVAPGITDTGLVKSGIERLRELGVYVQTPTEVALATAYLASHPTYNGRVISVSTGKYRELEGPYEQLKTELYGPDDWHPKTKEEVDATLQVLDLRL